VVDAQATRLDLQNLCVGHFSFLPEVVLQLVLSEELEQDFHRFSSRAVLGVSVDKC